MMLLAQNGVLFACFFALAGIVEEKTEISAVLASGSGMRHAFLSEPDNPHQQPAGGFSAAAPCTCIYGIFLPEREKFRLCLGQSLLAWVYRYREGYRALFCAARPVCMPVGGWCRRKEKKGARKSAASGSVAPISASDGSCAGTGSFSGCALFAVAGSCPDRPGRV